MKILHISFLVFTFLLFSHPMAQQVDSTFQTSQADSLKELGDQLLRDEKFDEALNCYHMALPHYRQIDHK